MQAAFKCGWYFLLGCGLFALVGGMLPVGDDWSYLTSPNLSFDWRQTFPGVAFWRPFDALMGGLLGQCLWAFPWLNRVIIVFGHVMNVVMVGRLIKKLTPTGGKFQTELAMRFFALSSAGAAVIVNTDSINQVWSFFFGICAVTAWLRDKSWKGIGKAGGLVFVSMLFKESGVSWLGVMVGIACFSDIESEMRMKMIRIAKVLGASLVIGVIYFGLRFGLRGDMTLGAGGDYAIGFRPAKFVVDLAINIVPSLTAVDILALLCRKWWIVGSTIALSLVFWLIVLMSVVRSAEARKGKLWIVLCMSIAVALAFPHCFFRKLHPAEMHFYPVLLAGALLVSRFQATSRRLRWCVWGAMLVLFAIGWCDKLYEAYGYSKRTEALLNRIKNLGLDFSRPVYLVVENDDTVNRYSGFTQSAAHGIYFGSALRSLNDWRFVEYHAVSNANEVPEGEQMVIIR